MFSIVAVAWLAEPYMRELLTAVAQTLRRTCREQLLLYRTYLVRIPYFFCVFW